MAQEEKKGIGDQAKDAVVDVRNELIVQSANLYLLVRRVLLSSLGAVALTVEEASDLMAKLVERGELAEADMQKIMSDLRAQSAEREADAAKAREELAKKAKVLQSAFGGEEKTWVLNLTDAKLDGFGNSAATLQELLDGVLATIQE